MVVCSGGRNAPLGLEDPRGDLRIRKDFDRSTGSGLYQHLVYEYIDLIQPYFVY